MQIFIPTELEPIRHDLQRFFDAMIFKLRKNAHKGRWNDLSLDTTFKRLNDEVKELEQAIKEGSSTETMMEAADVANFAMIACAIALGHKGEFNAALNDGKRAG